MNWQCVWLKPSIWMPLCCAGHIFGVIQETAPQMHVLKLYLHEHMIIAQKPRDEYQSPLWFTSWFIEPSSKYYSAYTYWCVNKAYYSALSSNLNTWGLKKWWPTFCRRYLRMYSGINVTEICFLGFINDKLTLGDVRALWRFDDWTLRQAITWTNFEKDPSRHISITRPQWVNSLRLEKSWRLLKTFLKDKC